MPSGRRLDYLKRTFSAYVLKRSSQLDFWHEIPEAEPGRTLEGTGPYYMSFRDKADYEGPFDDEGVPLLNYRGDIGQQHNPIAIAQWGLGNLNLYLATQDPHRLDVAMRASSWLVEKLEMNRHGIPVWSHNFDWHYRSTLVAPWYSGLAQGQGLSLLVRMHDVDAAQGYDEAAAAAAMCFSRGVEEGGVMYRSVDGGLWIEEYIVHPAPPTHILNGSIWALWGVYDYCKTTGELEDVFSNCVDTLEAHLDDYDVGYWSLYESPHGRARMLASPFYHRLHIVQLRIMYEMTGRNAFAERADRWQLYAGSGVNRSRALAGKALFKLLHY